MRPTLIGAIDVNHWWHRSWKLAAFAALLMCAFPSTSALADACEVETAMLRAVASAIQVSIDAPKGNTADGSMHVSWRADQRMALKTPTYIAIAIPGDVRFRVASVVPRPSVPDDDLATRPPELPGFLALTPQTRGPLGLEFGKGMTRALLPLHQPAAKLSGEFDVEGLSAGLLTIEAAVVARTSCGERIVSDRFDRTIELAPGAPRIVVQDPYDIDKPRKIVISNNGRYLAHVFDGRYRVYDIKTEAKLVDRAGKDINFSPTARFVVANAGSTGQQGHDSYEVIDLATGEIIATPAGPFIGWLEGDSYLLDAQGSFGVLTIRPTIISRRPTGPADPGREDVGDDLTFTHPGSCHACASWSDDNFLLDLDNGVLAFTGREGFAAATSLFELASGQLACCQPDDAQLTAILAKYDVLPISIKKGFNARTPLRFTHIYDAPADPRAKEFGEQDFFRDAITLKSQLLTHRVLDPKSERVAIAALGTSTAVRGDWRSRVADDALQQSPRTTATRILQELTRIGLIDAAPLEVEKVPFINSWLSKERGADYNNSEVVQKRVDALIVERTGALERRMIADVPILKRRLRRYSFDKDGLQRLPENPERDAIFLDQTLQGLWRWQIKERPVWLVQLWDSPGNAGIGNGVMMLFEGDAAHTAKTGGRIVNLTKSLEAFWSGQYGESEHESQLKPNVYLDRYLVMASVAARSIAVYDLDTDKVARIVTDIPQAGLLSEVVLSVDARHIVQVNSDGQYFIYHVATGKRVLAGRMVDEEIIAYTPEGYYWSTYEGAHFVEFQFPGLPGVYPFQQFASVLSRPDIIKAALLEGAEAAPPARLTPPPRLDIALLPTQSDSVLRMHISARGTMPLKRVSFYADGQPIFEHNLSGNAVSQEFILPGAAEAHWLTAQVVDSNGLASAPQSIRRAPSGRSTRELHAVLVGNDIYANPDLTLKYARHDAERLGSALKTLPGQFYARTTIEMLVNAAATPDAIRGAIERAVEAAKVEDTIVVSFAGHGLQDEQGAYYLTPYGFDDNRVAATALAWRDIASLLHQAKARVVVILDACHAGLSGSAGRGTNDDAVAALVAGEHSPMLVLAASKGRQVSYEGPNWDGGVFTYALISALRTKRADYDLDRDGSLEISELYRALRTIVSRETNGGQSPWLVREDLLGDFVVF
jgi:hypothetical protein